MTDKPNYTVESHSKRVSLIGTALGPAWKKLPAPRSMSFMSREADLMATTPIGGVAAKVLQHVDCARDVLVICSFLLASEALTQALLRAAKRGVRLYILVASEARLAPAGRKDDFSALCHDQHLDLLRRLSGVALVRTSRAFHAKVVLADPQPGGVQSGLLLTANLTDEALNRNEEIAVRLTDTQVAEAFAFLRHAFWELAEHETMTADFVPVRPLGKLEPPRQTGVIRATLPGCCGLRDAALGVVARAKNRIVVSSFGLELGDTVVRALIERASQGVDVVVLCRMRSSSFEARRALAQAGATVLGFNWLHAKAIWTDSGEGLVMSANLEAQGMDEGFEMGVLLDGRRAQALGSILDYWRKIAKWRFDPDGRISTEDTAMRLEDGRAIQDEVAIAEVHEEDLGVLHLRAKEDPAKTPEFPKHGAIMARAVLYRWKVRIEQKQVEMTETPATDVEG